MLYHVREYLLALSLALASVPAYAWDATRCDNDSDPVPGFAHGRDGDGCMEIESGNGSGLIKFDFEYTAGASPAIPPSSPECEDNDCGYVAWDVNADDYLEAGSSGGGGKDSGDAFHFSGRHYKYILLYNFGAGNTWKCKGPAWESPAEAFCTERTACNCISGNQQPPGCMSDPGAISCGHDDAIQIRGQPVNDGWLVMVDSKITNANDIHMILEMNDPEYVGPAPGAVFQHVFAGYEPGWGMAEDWGQDCQDMGDDDCGQAPIGNSPRWQVGSNGTSTTFKATWLINSYSHVRVQADRTAELVIINGGMGGGCDNVNGCDGSIGYENGWPAPLGKGLSGSGHTGPGTCSGYIDPATYDVRSDGGTNPVPVYCYPTIDDAIADGRAQPPLIELSNSGWKDSDADGVPDFRDNCKNVANADVACDTDSDGYGNRCDADYDQDMAVGGPDFSFWTMSPKADVLDHNCDGTNGGGPDYGTWVQQFGLGYPGPSGLACAGASPCTP